MKFRKGLVIFLALVLVFALAVGCAPEPEEPPPAPEPDENDVEEQVLTGEGQGYNEDVPIVVEVTMVGDEITAVDIVSHEETPGLSDPAFEEVPAAIIAAQSSSVDAVSGATDTSNGIMEAVANATGM